MAVSQCFIVELCTYRKNDTKLAITGNNSVDENWYLCGTDIARSTVVIIIRQGKMAETIPQIKLNSTRLVANSCSDEGTTWTDDFKNFLQ